MATLDEFKAAGYKIEEDATKGVAFDIMIPVVDDSVSPSSALSDASGQVVDEWFHDNEPLFYIRDDSGNIIGGEFNSLSSVGEYIDEMDFGGDK